LLFTNTDGITCEKETEDLYKDFWKNKNKFNNIDYPKNSKFYDKTNNKVTGKLKDEAAC